MLLQKLYEKGLLSCPKWLIPNTQYLAIGGSIAYGASGEASDWDMVGFCIPYKDDIFPHLRGEIPGFGRQKKRFEQYQEHHIVDQSAQKEYDFKIHSIIKFFHLCMENNPDCFEMLFVPQRCVVHITSIGNLVRENRKIFLHKGCFHRLKGYAYQQLHKMRLKNPQPGGKREKLIREFGFDTKFAMNVYRLLSQCEELFTTGDLTLDEVGRREVMKAIRRGEWTMERIEDYFTEKERALEKLYNESDKLPYSPDEEKIKALLMECLKMHFGDLDKCVVNENQATIALRQIDEILEKNKNVFRG